MGNARRPNSENGGGAARVLTTRVPIARIEERATIMKLCVQTEAEGSVHEGENGESRYRTEPISILV